MFEALLPFRRSSFILGSRDVLQRFDPGALCLLARNYFGPAARWDIIKRHLLYFDALDPHDCAWVPEMMAVMCPTLPAPPSSPSCQPSYLLPKLFSLLSMQQRSFPSSQSFLTIFSGLAADHLPCASTPFGAHGIFDEMQFREILRVVWLLAGIGDGTGQAFTDDVSSSARDTVAKQAALLVVSSLSPLCQRPRALLWSA